jgi:DNA-binding NarL/FixJ family response regulator
MTAIRVLIVDDHTLFREGLQAIFLVVQDIEIVGEAASGRQAIELAQELRPDVILMDIQMADLNGVAACQQILSVQPDTGIIMLTMLEDSASLFAAICAGARGYVLKGADKAEVLKTIHAVAQGEVLFGPAVANRVTSLFRNLSNVQATDRKSTLFPELTERESEILQFIAQGLNNQDIATRLEITAKTVSNHISNIFNKLQVVDRAQAIVKARKAGLANNPGE